MISAPGWNCFRRRTAQGFISAVCVFLAIADPSSYAITITYSSYLADASGESAIWDIAIDSQSNLYVVGAKDIQCKWSTTTAFRSNVAYSGGPFDLGDYFVTKFDSKGSNVLYSSCFGVTNNGAEAPSGGAKAYPTIKIALDPSGKIYLAGLAVNECFPTKQAYQKTWGGTTDAFVAKFDPDQAGDNSLVYSTYLGGTNIDEAFGIAVDPSSNVYVYGSTWSTNFPVKNAYQSTNAGESDLFLSKLDSTGTNLVFSTYFGATNKERVAQAMYLVGEIYSGRTIVIDSATNIYLTGATYSTNFPLVNAYNGYNNAYGNPLLYSDAFVVKLNPSASVILYSTLIGGAASDVGYGIALDRSSNIYMAGRTYQAAGADFPCRNGWTNIVNAHSGAFARFDPSRTGDSTLVYSTIIGNRDGYVSAAHNVAVDVVGYAYIVGMTSSTNFITKNAWQPTNTAVASSWTGQDMFLMKLDTTLTGTDSIVYSTYMGYTDDDRPFGLVVTNGGIYIGGACGNGGTWNVPFQPITNAFMSASPGPRRVGVFMKLEEAVQLAVSPLGLTNSIMVGHNASSKTIEVWNALSDSMPYAISDDMSWLVTSATNGASSGAHNSVVITNQTAGLAVGSYSGLISVIANARSSPQNVAVSLAINPRPMVSISTTSFSRVVLEGKNPTNQSFEIWNGSGSYTLDYRLSVNAGQSWMSVTTTNGLSTGGHDTIALNYNTASLPRGSYTGSILVTGTDTNYGETADNSSQTVSVYLTVSHPLPSVAVSVTGLAQWVQKGANATNQSFLVSNGNGNYTLSYGVSGNQSWFSVNPSSGTSTGEADVVTAQYAVSGFDGGTYTGQVTVAGVDATYGDTAVSSPWVIPVAVYVVNPGTPLLSASDGEYTDKVKASWSGVTNAANYQVWRGTSGSIGAASLVTTVTETSYDDTTAEPGILKYYWVRAVNAYGGVGSFSALDTGWRGLGVPTGVTASDGSYTDKVMIGWGQMLDVSGYQVWWNTMNDSGSAQLLGSATGSGVTNYEDYGASPGVLYYYWVRIVCSGGTGDFSSVDSGWRGLESPGGVSASDGTYPDKVRVRWSAVSGAELYEVWRGVGEVSGAEWVGETMGVRYDDTNAVAGVAYDYWVRAKCALGSSAYSASDRGWRATAGTPYVRDGEEGDVNITTNSALVFRWGNFAHERLDHCEVAIGTSETNLTGCLGWTGVYGPEGRYPWGTEMALGRWYYSSVRGVDENGAVVVGPVTSDGITYVGNKLAPVYRVYSYGAPESTYEHLYTMNAVEVEVLDSWPSWQAEGVAWYGLVSQEGLSAPLYRMYNGFWRQHYYTADTDEYVYLGEYRQDWDGEGVQYYVMREAAPGTMPVYHFYHPGIVAHFYTMDENEAMTVLANAQWGLMYQGISFYVFPVSNY